MARHLIDSDVLIWVLRGKSVAVEFLGNLLKEEIPAISTMAVYELWAGSRVKEEEVIDEFLSSFHVLPITAEIAKEGAHYYKEYRVKGITLSTVDALIAATAQIHRLVLVTQNQRDFPMRNIEKKSL